MYVIKWVFASLFIAALCQAKNSSDRDIEADVTYRITFKPNWTVSGFPTHFPVNRDHFSGLIGTTHNSKVSFWGRNQLATQGIETVAETGSKGDFKDEIQEQKNKGLAEFLLSSSGLPSGTASVAIEFDVNKSHPLVTLISMIAPSPDWFVGVHGLSLLDSNGQWERKLVLNLPLYDAGTDSGNRFTSFNSNSSEFISLLTSSSQDTDFKEGVHRRTGEYIGQFIFEKIK